MMVCQTPCALDAARCESKDDRDVVVAELDKRCTLQTELIARLEAELNSQKQLMNGLREQLSETTMKLDIVNKKLDQKAQVNQHLESVAQFLREENERLSTEAEDVAKHNKRMMAALSMRKSSLLALTKSNKNLGMRILDLERTLSENNITLRNNNVLSLDNWGDDN